MTYFDPSKPHPCERIARIEGQTNYWRLLAGVEEGVDTTEDMAALSFARKSGCPPELLEAYWGGSKIHRRELCLMCFRVLDAIGRGIRDKDRVWTLGAIIDGFDRFCGRYPPRARLRASKFGVRYEDYLATRNLAEGLFFRWTGFVQPEWITARYRRENRRRCDSTPVDLLTGMPGHGWGAVRKGWHGKQPMGQGNNPDDGLPAVSEQAA